MIYFNGPPRFLTLTSLTDVLNVSNYVDCYENCGDCIGPEIDDCASCKYGNIVYYTGKSNSFSCVSHCPYKYFALGGECIKCMNICDTCLSATTCTNCSFGYLKYVAPDLAFDCVPMCPSHYYTNGSDCLLCMDICIECQNGVTCISCKIGYFNNLLTSICEKCHSLCSECTGPYNSSCTKCKDEQSIANLQSGSCDCKVSYFYDDHLCSQCHSLCLKCTSPSNSTCLQCVKAEGVTDQLNSTCDCLKGYYYDSLIQSCIECELSCQQCTFINVCTECTTGYLMVKGKCIPNCTYSISQDSLTQALLYCIYCNAIINCSRCTTIKCIQCSNPYILYNNVCNLECPQGYYIYKLPDLTECRQCHRSCLTCASFLGNKCILCNKGYQKDITNNYCIKTVCQPDEYLNDTLCYPCHIRCSSCTGPEIDQCLTCKPSFIGRKINLSKNVRCMECSEISKGMYYRDNIQSCDGIIVIRNMWRWD